MRKGVGVLVCVAAGGFLLSDLVLENACRVALSARQRQLGNEDARVEVDGIHTSILFATRPCISLKRIKVELPAFATAEAHGVKLEFSSKRDLFRSLFEQQESVVDLVKADDVEIQLSQQVFLSLVKSSASVGVSLPGLFVGSVFEAGSSATKLLVGKSRDGFPESPTRPSSSVAIQSLDVKDVRVRVLVGSVELPTMLRVPQVRLERLHPSIESAAELTVGIVSILVQTVVSSSISTLGNVLSLAGSAVVQRF